MTISHYPEVSFRAHERPVVTLTITDETTRDPHCPADVNGDGETDVDDLVALIVAWGSADPFADVDDSGEVDVDDLVALVVAWGPCS